MSLLDPDPQLARILETYDAAEYGDMVVLRKAGQPAIAVRVDGDDDAMALVDRMVADGWSREECYEIGTM
jgi:hypothetical protein